MKRINPSVSVVIAGILALFLMNVPSSIGRAAPTEEPVISVSYVLDSQKADVTGDGVADLVEILGQKTQADSIYHQNIQLVIQDGRTGEKTILDLPDLKGYEAKLFFFDFTGDQVQDVLLTLSTGSSGGIVEHRIVTFTGKEFKVIFDKDNNQGVHFSGQYLDGLKAELKNEETGRSLVLDISRNRDTYWAAQLYDKDSKLLRKVTPYALPFSRVDVVRYEKEGIYGLRGYQRISGAYNADGLGQVQSWWKYENNRWVVKQIEFSTYILATGEIG